MAACSSSADADFASLLALRSQKVPSVILIRGQTHRRASDVTGILVRLLPDLEADLDRGAAVSIRGERVRIRALPVRRTTRRRGGRLKGSPVDPDEGPTHALPGAFALR